MQGPLVDVALQKQTMRRDIKAARDGMVGDLPPAISNMAFSIPPSPLRVRFRAGLTIAGYAATGSEADISRLLQFAFEAGCHTALPYITGATAPMRFLSWSPGEPLVTGPFDLQQPQAEAPETKPDIILAPMVAFDRGLHRLGQGAGHYDRALSLLDDSFVIGVGWSIQEVAAVPVEIWDVPMNAVLTEKEWIEI